MNMEIGKEIVTSYRIQRPNGDRVVSPMWTSNSFYFAKQNKEKLEKENGEKDLQIIKITEMRIV